MSNVFHLPEFLASIGAKNKVEFPVEAFPSGIQRILRDTNERLLFPLDFTGAGILYAIGLAVGNTHKVQVNSEWVESAALFIALAGRPGTNKSHPLSFLLNPFYKRDQASLRVYEKLKREYDLDITLSKKERESLGKLEPVKPYWQKHLIQDYTPEALLELHKYNPRGLGVYSDELMGFFKNFNRYSNGGSDTEFWLSAWSAKPIIQDRKSAEPIMISHPFLPVIGTIQTNLLESLAQGNRQQNGFMDRMLFVFPENLKKEYWNKKDICPSVVEDWDKYINKLLEIPLQMAEDLAPNPYILPFSPKASQLLHEWQRHNTDLVNSAPVESLAGVYTKLETYCIRLSLILQMAAFATGEGERRCVEEEAVIGAIRLAEYFRYTGTRVHDIITRYDPLENLPEDKRIMYEALPSCFQTKEGEKIAKEKGMPLRTFKYFLNNMSLFKRLTRGKYLKLI